MASIPTMVLIATVCLLIVPSAVAWGSGPECDNKDLLSKSYTIERADGSVVIVNDLHNAVEEGDRITAGLQLAPECDGKEFSLVSYTAPGPTFSRDTAHLQEVFDHDTDTGEAKSPRRAFVLILGPIMVPDCFFQVDLVRGKVLQSLGPADSNNFYSDQGRLLDADNGGKGGCEVPDCPGDLEAKANADESITLSWSASAEADGYRVLRATGGGSFATVADVSTTTYTDNSTEAGVTYRYVIVAYNANGESEECAEVEVTAVPFFGAPILGALAIAGAVGTYAVFRRR